MYAPPVVTYHGTVAELTRVQDLASGGQILAFAAAFANSITQPNQPNQPGGGGGGGGGNNTPLVPETPSGTGGEGAGGGPGLETVAQPGGGSGTSPGGGSSPGGGGAPTGGGSPGGGAETAGAAGGDGGRLPFTGLAIIGVAGVGAAMASAGAVMKRLVGSSDDEAA